MIDVRVLDIQPHPDQATNNPGCWAVQYRVAHDGRSRSFWRWYNVRELRSGRYVTPPNDKKPTHAEILADFWEDTFGNLHGFSFDKAAP